MTGQPSPSEQLREQLWNAADPTGENRHLISTLKNAPGLPEWMRRFDIDIAESWDRLKAAGAKFSQHMQDVENALRVLTPRGWAIMYMPTEVINEAVRLVDSGKPDEADTLLADQWDGPENEWRTLRVCKRVRGMGFGDTELSAIFAQRARLLTLAKEHHDAHRYDGCIPTLQAQMEGIVIDVTGGRKFFSGRPTERADLVDPRQLVSIESSLSALQAEFGQGVNQTQATGGHSRHGLVHGRELAFDTRVNSAKYWSVLDSLVEWALPRARSEVDRRRAERQASNAGSQEVDEDGRRIDDREFAETKDVLRLLETSAIGWCQRRGGRFRSDLVNGVYTPEDFEKRRLPRNHGIHEQVSDDELEVSYWRATGVCCTDR